MSVPNQKSADGGFSRLIGDTACGSTVPSHGASSAMAIMNSSTAPPTIAVGCRRNAVRTNATVETAGLAEVSRAIADMRGKGRSVPNPRVDHHVREIDREIDEHVDGGEQQDDALDDRIVPPQDRIDGQAAD